MERPLIHVVADYGPTTELAFGEVMGALLVLLPKAVIIPTSVPTFSTVAAAFFAYQLASRVPAAHGHRMLVFVNVDARRHTDARIQNGDGASLYCGRLQNNVRILGPGLGIFTVARHCRVLKELMEVPTEPFTNGEGPGQFRSRDVYPGVIYAMLSEQNVQTQAVPLELIPELGTCVLHVDGYGNVKTSLRRHDLNENQHIIAVKIAERMVRVEVRSTLFDAEPGKLALYPGSSGPPEDPFLELAVRFDGKYQWNAQNALRCDKIEPGCPVSLQYCGPEPLEDTPLEHDRKEEMVCPD